jgi:hypothetical protein
LLQQALTGLADEIEQFQRIIEMPRGISRFMPGSPHVESLLRTVFSDPLQKVYKAVEAALQYENRFYRFQEAINDMLAPPPAPEKPAKRAARGRAGPKPDKEREEMVRRALAMIAVSSAHAAAGLAKILRFHLGC